MKLLPSLAAGFAGAVALTALHEVARRLRPHDAPRMDVLGERGLRKILNLADLPQPSEGKAYTATMLGDILSNGLYYTVVGSGKHSLQRGLALGGGGGHRGRGAAWPDGPGRGAQQPHTPNQGHDRGLVHAGWAGSRGRSAEATPAAQVN